MAQQDINELKKIMMVCRSYYDIRLTGDASKLPKGSFNKIINKNEFIEHLTKKL